MTKIDSFTQACYDYLDEARLYLNDSTQLGPILENKFGLECYIARQIVSDWISYHEKKLTHPYDRTRFRNWWSQPYSRKPVAISN